MGDVGDAGYYGHLRADEAGGNLVCRRLVENVRDVGEVGDVGPYGEVVFGVDVGDM